MNIEEVNAILRQFEGGHGRLVRYSDGLEMLRIELRLDRRTCEIVCKGCRYLASATVWTGVKLKVERIDDDVVELTAIGGEPRVRCWVVSCEVSEIDPE